MFLKLIRRSRSKVGLPAGMESTTKRVCRQNPPNRQDILTESERDALVKAISERSLEEQGWVEGSRGEIVNDRGRTVFEIGFTRAIRKMLENDGVNEGGDN